MSEPVLVAEGLRYAWPARAVGPLDWRLPPGAYQVLGGNGSGKTTALRLLCGALRPDAGVARVLGRDVHADPTARRDVVLVPVRPELPEWLTVDEAWRMTAAIRDRAGWDGAGFRDALGLPGNARLATLSAGQRRRAEIVAGLAGDPAVLLLDEPFADLDAAGQALLADWIAGWRASRVVIFAHHGVPPLDPDGVLSVGGGK